MITHLEPDILECEVKWALGSITTNKAVRSVGDGIPVELFQILKDDALKVLHSIGQQIWKSQQWPQDWKRSVFIAIPKKGNAKECSDYCTVVLNFMSESEELKSLLMKVKGEWKSWLKTQQWPQDWKKSVFIPIPKKGNTKECSNYHTIVLISHTSKVMLKILQANLQHYVNQEYPDV